MSAVTGHRRAAFRDDTLPHQIYIYLIQCSTKIAVSCNCLATRNTNGTLTYHPLESRSLWEPGEAIAAWRVHMAAEAVA